MTLEKELLPAQPAAAELMEGEINMAWIPLHQTLPTHRKTRKLARELGLSVPQDIPQVVGHLCIFWLWCIDNVSDGVLSALDMYDIADAAGWAGDAETFYRAMIKSGFIDDADAENPIRVHDWEQYIGRYVDRMEQFRIKQEKERERNRVKQQNRRERLRAAQAEAELVARGEQPAPSQEEAPDAQFGVDPEWLKVVQCYQKNIGQIPVGRSLEMLVSYYEDLSADVVCKAIEETNKDAPSNPWRYLKAILDNWAEKGINSSEMADAYIKDIERQREETKRRKDGKNNGNEPPSISGGFY